MKYPDPPKDDKSFWDSPQEQDAVETLFGVRVEGWDDTEFRHAYWPNGIKTKVAMCGYDGPSTWTGEKREPPSMCPICQALIRDKAWQE
jgi:hypothetical protein